MNWIFVNPWSLGTKDTDIDIDKHLRTIPYVLLILPHWEIADCTPQIGIPFLACSVSDPTWARSSEAYCQNLIFYCTSFLESNLCFTQATLLGRLGRFVTFLVYI